MPKSYNTSAYRHAKRVVAFVDPKLKREIIKQAKLRDRSISEEISIVLGMHYVW